LARKKKSIELSDKKISFELGDITYKVIRYYPTSMTLDVMAFENKEKLGMKELAFAHLPKEIKKIIKPN